MTQEERRRISEALYLALSKYRDGRFKDRQIGAGTLSPELSAILIDTETEMKTLVHE